MKNLLLSAFLVGLLAVVAFSIERTEISGRSAASLAPVYQNDGDTFDGFSVDCGSNTWSVIKAARAERRRIHIQVLDSNAGGVCVSTITAAGTACDDDALGVELSTGSAGRYSIDLFTEAQLNCRARADVSTQTLKGFEAYDSGD